MNATGYKALRNSIATIKYDPSKSNELRKGVVSKHAKFRVAEAYVDKIVNVESGEDMDSDVSIRDSTFIYQVGKVVFPDSFDENIDEVCTFGIHYFKTKETAVSWFYNQTGCKYPDGPYKEWYGNGQICQECNYKNGELDGPYKAWCEHGEISKECNYKDGKLDGQYKEWCEHGQPFRECNYKDGEIVFK